jgi:outer membrane protein
MKNFSRINFIILLLITVIVGWNIYQYFAKPKTGYVVISEVYNNFDFKKEMEKKFEVTKNAREKILDSIKLEIKLIENKVLRSRKIKPSDTIGYHEMINDYLSKKQTFDEDNTTLSQKYDEQIVTQLNQYIKDFGEAYHYTYIFGTGGNGTLMYAKESENISKDVTEYINKKYKGEK